MTAQADANLLRGRHYFLQKGNEMAAKPIGRDAVVFVEMRPQRIQRQMLSRAGKTEGNVSGEFLPASLAHTGKAAGRLFGDRSGETFIGSRPSQDMDVEHGEIDEIEAHASAAVREAPSDIGARPVQH